MERHPYTRDNSALDAQLRTAAQCIRRQPEHTLGELAAMLAGLAAAYARQFNDRYEEYAREYPPLHELREAAKILDIGRSTLYTKLERYGIDPAEVCREPRQPASETATAPAKSSQDNILGRRLA